MMLRLKYRNYKLKITFSNVIVEKLKIIKFNAIMRNLYYIN